MEEIEDLACSFDMGRLDKVEYFDDVKVWRAFSSISEPMIPKYLFDELYE